MKNRKLAERIFTFYDVEEADTGVDPAPLAHASNREAVEFVARDLAPLAACGGFGGDISAAVSWYFRRYGCPNLGGDICKFAKANGIF